MADVRAACDVFPPVYEATGGGDGLVSLEVSPDAGARHRRPRSTRPSGSGRAVDRPNAMIKIPGTAEGLPAITHCIAAGINVNITLLFSVERYAEVIEAFLAGLERAARDGAAAPADRARWRASS